MIEEQISEGDKVMTRITIKRIHDRGEFLGLAPTRMELKTSAILINRVVGARSSRSGVKVRVFWRRRGGVQSKRESSVSA
jgi:predicted ester cyclase